MGLNLVASKLKTKRSKTMIALLLPVIVCIFILGWIMYWVGDNSNAQKNRHAKPVKDNVTIGAIVREENQEILAH
jgi:flagellar basal body-associated protein FliL